MPTSTQHWRIKLSSIVVAGDTSGSVTLSAPAVAGTTTLTLPSVSGTVLASGTAVTVAQVCRKQTLIY